MKTTFLVCVLAMSSVYAQPPDKPVHGTGEQAAEAHDRALAPYIAKARATFPQAKKRFLKGLAAREKFYVMTRLYSDHDTKTEDIFVEVQSIKDGLIHGIIDSKVLLVKPYQKGDRLAFPETGLMDWTILHADGREEGNVVGKFIDTLQK